MIEELVIECPDLAIIEYHSGDDYSNVYSDARVAYYNVVAFPKSTIDGFWQPDWSNYEAYVDDYTARKDLTTNYSVDVELEGDGTNFNGSVQVSWFAANNDDKVLHIVLTESHIEESWYGGEEINYVLRLMIPDQYGTPLAEGENTDEEFVFEFSLEEDWAKDSCELVVFVQDTLTQEVYQANSILLSEVEVDYYDIALEEIIEPGEEHCGDMISPVIKVKNQCSGFLSSMEIQYEINGEEYLYSWTGNMFPNVSQFIYLPEVPINLLVDNDINVTISDPNGEADQNPDNDNLDKSFTQAEMVVSDWLSLELKTDDFGAETQWMLTNSAGEIVEEGSGYENNTLYSFTWMIMGDECYTFTILDSGGNGICCVNGDGYYKILDWNGNLVFDGGEFLEEENIIFQFDLTVSVEYLEAGRNFLIFPNPASDEVNIQTQEEILEVKVYSHSGQLLVKADGGKNWLTLNTAHLDAGLYLIRIQTAVGVVTQSLIIK